MFNTMLTPQRMSTQLPWIAQEMSTAQYMQYMCYVQQRSIMNCHMLGLLMLDPTVALNDTFNVTKSSVLTNACWDWWLQHPFKLHQAP